MPNGFMSSASRKPARFLKWNYEHKMKGFDCVYLFNGAMTTSKCSFFELFICQLDNEV